VPGDLELDGRDKVLRQGPSVLGAMVCEMQYERAAAFDADFGALRPFLAVALRSFIWFYL